MKNSPLDFYPILTTLFAIFVSTISISCVGSIGSPIDGSITDGSITDDPGEYDGNAYDGGDFPPDGSPDGDERADDGGSISRPLAPANLNATALSSSQIVLSWEDRSDNESSFAIDQGLEDGTFEEVGHTEADVCSYTAVGLMPQSLYRFRVRAVNEAGSSDASNIASATTLKEDWTCPGQVISLPSPGPGADIAAALQDAIDGAQAGDCIEIPAGEFLMGTTVTMHQPISLIGAGADTGGSMLYHSNADSNTLIHVDVPSDADCHMLVKGIRFSGKAPGEQAPDVETAATDYGLRFTTCAGFQVTESRFEHFGYAGIQVKHADCHADGIIYGNSFYRNIRSGLGYGVVVYGTNEQWCEDPEFGSKNFIFVEDNDFEEHRHSLAGGGAGRYVVRYNTIRENLWGHAIDMHEARGGSLGNSNYHSTRAVEAYHNDLINTKFRNGDPIGSDTHIDNLNDLVGWAIGFRGGEGIAFDNNFVGYCYVFLLITYDDEYPPVYPIFTQIGYASALTYGDSHVGTDASHGAGDFFEWGNTWVSYTAPNYPDGVNYLKNYSPEYIQQDRDYHPETPKPGYAPFPYPHPDRWW